MTLDILILARLSIISLFGFMAVILWSYFQLPGHAYLEHAFELYPWENGKEN